MELEIKHRSYLNKKAIKELKAKIPSEWHTSLGLKDTVEYVEFKNAVRLILVGRIPTFVIFKERDTQEEIVIPHLRLLVDTKKIILPKVVVDKGAVPFVMNGANIMRPGVIFFENTISKGDIVGIYPEKFDKPIAVGKSLINSEEFNKLTKGAIAKNLHYLNDLFWKLVKKL